jgi:hypothetical protein
MAGEAKQEPKAAKEPSFEERLRLLEEKLADERAAREEAEALTKRVSEEARIRVAAAEAGAKARIAEAERAISDAVGPAPQRVVSSRAVGDIAVVCMKTQTTGVRAGNRTYSFAEGEEIQMDPNHAEEYVQTGWVRILGKKR